MSSDLLESLLLSPLPLFFQCERILRAFTSYGTEPDGVIDNILEYKLIGIWSRVKILRHSANLLKQKRVYVW